MKRLITSAGLAALAVTVFAPTSVMAQDAPAAAPADPLSFNIGVVSDYRYRGISQTRLKPALQGGMDYAFPNGFYIGTWASTIKWIKDNGVSGGVELDLYGGYKGAITDALSFDAGFLRYQYVGNKLQDTGGGGVYSNANTTEVYGALTFGPATVKGSYALTDTFGNKNSDASYYLEAAAGFDVGAGFTLTPHLGYQKITNTPGASYTDYSITASKEVVSGLTLSLAGVGTNASQTFYVPGAAANSSKFLGRKGFVVGLKYAF